MTTTTPRMVDTVRAPWAKFRARHRLFAFALRRLCVGMLTLLVASFVIFLATMALPGDVARAVLGQNATPDLVENLNRELGLDRPLLTQYGEWLSGVVRGDLGDSAVALAQGNPESSVNSLIATPLFNSMILAGITMLILLPLAVLIGTFVAANAGRAGDYAVSYPLLVVGGLPEFVFGTILIAAFFSWLGLLPPVSLVLPGESPLANPVALVLPVLTLLGVLLAFCARQVRAGVMAGLQSEYVTAARLSGISEGRVLWSYALRNGLPGSIQTFAQSFQYLFGGIIVVELLYAYQGIGATLVNAVTARDVTAVQGITLIIASAFILINIVADLLVVFLVPKLRTSLR